MTSTLPVIVNRKGGAALAAGAGFQQEVEEAFAALGISVAVRLVEPDQLAPAVSALADEPLVVVGGGDGSISSAAQARIASGGALAILPLGTRNHLARELGIPLDLAGAAAVAVSGATRRIDLGQVGELLFVNNASIGFYPLMVRWREAERQRRRLPKWLATLPAAWAALRRLRHHHLDLRMNQDQQAVRTPILFVGNNRYMLEAGRIGQRTALDDGTLSIFAVAVRSRLGLVWLAVRMLFGLADLERDFAALGECRALTVESRSRRIDIAIDGEVRCLSSPLLFKVRPRALQIRVPADPVPAEKNRSAEHREFRAKASPH